MQNEVQDFCTSHTFVQYFVGSIVSYKDVYICRDTLDDENWKKILNACFDRMYEKAVELGGLVSGEHGIGYAKKEFLKRQYGETPIALMQGIKQVFDPKNILNPGKVCF